MNVVIPAGEICAGTLQIEPVHDPGQLLSYIIRRLQGAVVAEVVIAPLGVLMV